jgi:hypothetical protein
VRVAGPVLALAVVVFIGIGGVFAVGVQLDKSDPSGDLAVEYNVTSVGGGNSETEVRLRVDGEIVDSERTRPLGQLVFDTGTLVYDDVGTVGDTVEFNVSVVGNTVNRSGSVAVVEDAQPTSPAPVDGFAVTIDSTTAPVSNTQNATVTATVNNTGTSTDTQTITTSIDGITNSTSVTLDPGNSTTVSLSVGPLSSPGRFTGEVTSADDSDTIPILATGEVGFTPVIVSTDAPDEVNGSSAAGETVTEGIETVVGAVSPLVLVVAGLGIVGFIIAATRPLRGGRGGGR